MGLGGGAGRGPGVLLGTEVCATLLLFCWLCCWPDDSNSDTSSGEHPRKPVLLESGSRRRSGELFSRRIASSAVSLHLPSTSGYTKQSLSAHRSHEEIRSRRKSHHEATDAETRYHSAPSVIDEVIHRRDWERSTRDLYIPLNPDSKLAKSESSPSLEAAPYAEPESSSIECLKPEEYSYKTSKLCKKHYTNIKSSKGKKCKESNRDDIKDTDATETVEVSNFYIGDNHENSLLTRASPINPEDSAIMTRASTSNYDDFVEYERMTEERNRSIHKAKEAKQSFNESIRLKEMPRKNLVPVTEGEVRTFGFCLDDDIDGIDRSGAVHHTIESRMSLRPYPPPSVETVGYEGGACYLGEAGSVSELRSRVAGSMSPHVAGAVTSALRALDAAPTPPGASLRARHASDGDILAPPHRPESGAFSESDLDLDLESEERPPDYNDLELYASPKKKETAI